MRSLALVAAAILLSACSQASSPASQSTPTPTAQASPAASPKPVTGAFAVLATPALNQSSYTLSLVGADGKVVASSTAATRSGLTCGNGAAGVVLPSESLSATADRVYFQDGNAALKWLAPDGSRGTANPVPGGGSVASTFAVSPDNKRIAVVSADYSRNPIPYRIYVEDVAGGNRAQIFSASSTSTIPWALGWHGGQLVLGYAPACTQGGGPFSAFPTEIHLVDPGTAVRSATLGNSTCPLRSLPAADGALCANADGTYSRLDWTGSPASKVTFGSDLYFALALSPGGAAAACCDPAGEILVDPASGAQVKVPGGAQSIGFIDDAHLLVGGDTAQAQSRVYTVNGSLAPVAALGDFLARIPGGL